MLRERQKDMQEEITLSVADGGELKREKLIEELKGVIFLFQQTIPSGIYSAAPVSRWQNRQSDAPSHAPAYAAFHKGPGLDICRARTEE